MNNHSVETYKDSKPKSIWKIVVGSILLAVAILLLLGGVFGGAPQLGIAGISAFLAGVAFIVMGMLY